MFRKLALALVAPLLVTAACAHEADPAEVGGAAGSTDLVSAVRAAPDVAADAGSGRIEMLVAIDTPDGPVEMVVTGAYDGARAALEIDVAAMLAAVGGAAGEAVPEGFDEPMQVVVDGATTYVRVPMLEAITGTSGWLVASAEDLGAAAGSLGFTGAAGDPTQLLQVLRGVAGDLEDLGRVEVRGVPTTHHRATIRIGEVLASGAPEQRAGLEALLGELGALALEELPVEVWIDGDGLVRRMQVRLDGAGAELGLPGALTLTLELFDYGEPVDISIPSAGEVTDVREVLPGVLG